MRIVDLSFPIRPHFRWKVELQQRASTARGDNFTSSNALLGCHAYTHVDAPCHFLPDGRHIAQMPVDQWMGEAAVVDLTHLGENGAVTASDLDTRAGHVRAGDIVLLRTDWPRRVSVESEDFWRIAPYTERSACEWLIGRRVKAVGYDYPPDYTVRTGIFSPDTKVAREDCTTHYWLFPAGLPDERFMTEAPTPELRLAPMAGVTNAPFRLVARECGAGLLTSEEIDARALVADNAHTRELARHLPEERPLAMQLLGADPEVLAEAARRLEAAGADAVDLNMGCPVAKIVAKGQGAALMRDPWKAALVFRAMRKALTVPFTIKIRGGWDDRAVNAVEIARLAEDEGVDAITVHPRTRSQQFSGRAPWDILAEVVAAVAIPVTGNGDVRSRADAVAMQQATGCAAVMIGRGALGAPWVFRADPTPEPTRARVIERHCALIREHLPERLALLQLKKHLAWYSSGRPYGARLRPSLFATPEADALQALFWRHWHEAAA